MPSGTELHLEGTQPGGTHQADDRALRVTTPPRVPAEVAHADEAVAKVSAQATALSARRSLVQLAADRQTTAVALIQALGGGWTSP